MGDRTRKVAASKFRTALPAELPRPVKRTGSSRGQPPAHVRTIGVDLDPTDREHIRQKLGRRLSKFGTSIERISVRLTDTNGPRGGIDKICRIKVVLSGLPSVVTEHRDASKQAAIDGALSRIEPAVRSRLGRARMKPLHGRASRPLVRTRRAPTRGVEPARGSATPRSRSPAA
ncbi:HPF/RaiA family ribosome-associated protein [Sorangium sp. So ce341]|uniref:HPF/RaiA family ribosome-associated protein n=1 Tax=Sorangium sp. So ce341 TaxID=3133302 RepID=UPI003F5DF763